MDIISVALKRHSTKAFDPSKKLTAEEAEKIKTLLQYSPSSTNSQRGILLLPALRKVKRAWPNLRQALTCSTNAK